ncbi:hypothetical protein BH11PAT1_BH11PAT1_2190 [soil metagenome]
MRRNKRSFSSLIIASISSSVLLFLLFFISPKNTISLGNVHISLLFPFFLLLFLSTTTIIIFLSKSRLHGVLIGLLACSYLLFRLFNLTHPFFIFILLALFLTLELLFARPKQ